MKDTNATIQMLKDKVDLFVKERDWNKFHLPKNVSMSLAVEAAELMEKFLWMGSRTSKQELENNRDEIEQELADVMLNVLAFANACNIDVASVLEHKLALTSKRYPAEKVKGDYTKYKALKKSLKQQ